MKLSKRCEYALRALIDLGVAAELGRPLVQVRELAEKEKLPTKFLEQIFTQLKAGGYVSTTRGKFGGYSLAKPAKRIKFGAVVRLIEGPLAPIGCVSLMAYAPCSCPDEAHCGLRMLMLDVRNAIAKVLDRYTLDEIVEITLRKLRRDGLTSPFLLPVRRLLPLPAELGMLSPDSEPDGLDRVGAGTPPDPAARVRARSSRKSPVSATPRAGSLERRPSQRKK
jgi:Rrf2 family protein